MATQWPNRGTCPECGASNANVQHEDGHSFCFSCETRFGNEETKNAQIIPMSEKSSEYCKMKGMIDAILIV